jgi:hypothetical protein
MFLSGHNYRRKVLADALVPCSFAKGEAIFTQGKPEGVKFHIIEKVGLYKLNPFDPKLESAWFQLLNL